MTSASAPMPNPISAAMAQAITMVPPALAKPSPTAASRQATQPTRAPEKRSSKTPVTRRPTTVAAPITEDASAAEAAVSPPSVSMGTRCATAAFTASEKRKNASTSFQKSSVRRAWRDAMPPSGTGLRLPSLADGSRIAAGITPNNKTTPASQRRDYHCTHPNAGHHKCQRHSPPTIEPRRNNARIGELRCAIANDSHHDVSCIELSEASSQKRHGAVGKAEDRGTGEDDSLRSDAVGKSAQEGRTEAHGQRADRKCQRNLRTRPAEAFLQRLDKNAEAENHNRREADRDAQERRTDDPPGVPAHQGILAKLHFPESLCILVGFPKHAPAHANTHPLSRPLLRRRSVG